MEHGEGSLFNHALINLLINILPVMIYQFYGYKFGERHLARSRYLWFTPIPVVVCMMFPITMMEGFQVDLRHVHIIIASLIGSLKFGIMLSLISIVYRFLIGGVGAYYSILIMSMTLLACMMVRKKFQKGHQPLRYSLLAIPVFVNSVTLLLCSRFLFPRGEINYSIQFLSLSYLSAFSVLYLIEIVHKNMTVNRKLQNAERLQVVSEMAASVSHDIRNPLTVVSGFVQMMRMKELGRDKQLIYLNLIEEELKRSQEIIHNYLSLAKSKGEEETELDLSEEMEYVRSIILPYANLHNVEVQAEIQANVKMLLDRNHLRQSLINLCKNGVEAMPNGGTLQLQLQSKHSSIIITIKDTGIGMTNEQLERIGTPFFTNKTNGTGIGILIVKNMLKTLGGTLEVSSSIGKGTSFKIVLSK